MKWHVDRAGARWHAVILFALSSVAGAQCDQPWFEPRALYRSTPVAAIDADGAGLLEIVARDNAGLAVWTLDQGPIPQRSPIFDGGVDEALAADFDGDGDTDIAAITDSRQMVRVFTHEAGAWTETATIAIQADGMVALDHLGDGDTDLLVIDHTGEAHILVNPGNGALSDLGVVISGSIHDAQAARINADALDDLYLSFGSTADDSAVYLQQGDGTFIPGPPPGVRPDLLADMNHDGVVDILVNANGVLEWRPALGDGSFANATTLIAADLDPGFAGDLDGDGDTDILGTNADNQAVVYRNLGSNAFEPVGQVLPASGSYVAMFAADIDGDGALDLFTSESSDAIVLRGNGNCSFLVPPAADLPAPLSVRRMTTGDLDHDGDTDAVLLTAPPGGEAGVAIYLNDGSGNFSLLRTESGADGADGYEPPVLADLDHDGDTDIAFWVDGRVVMLENTPDGQFSARHEVAAGQTFLGAPLLSADLDRNGLPDLIYPPSSVGEHATVLLNQGGWDFVGQALDTDPYPVPRALLDLTGDGIEDLVATNSGITGGELGVLPGHGDATFGAPIVSDLINQRDAFFFPGDFNGDGRTDLLSIPSSGPSIALLSGDGAGGFTDLGEVARYSSPRGIGVADFNEDGFDDFVAGSQTTGSVDLTLSDGDGTFSEPITLAVDSSLTAATAQLDGRGGIDILIAHNRDTASGTLTTLLNQCGPYPCPVDLNHDGRADTLDFVRFLNLWAGDSSAADWDQNGRIDTRDLVAFLNEWVGGCA
ncbi:MAG: VCBS repeat-containing protein [Phycisphaerales bacterium]|nr:VCBS repeat-containing protein [Phycisphaerales bacterium]